MGDAALGDVDEHITVAAPPGAVWAALVDAERRRSWWSYLELEPVVGGRFTERWVGADGEEALTAGTVRELRPERLLRLAWADEGWDTPTEVEITLTPVEIGTEVRVRHRGWALLPQGPRLADDHRAGWRAHLQNLRRRVEGERQAR